MFLGPDFIVMVRRATLFSAVALLLFSLWLAICCYVTGLCCLTYLMVGLSLVWLGMNWMLHFSDVGDGWNEIGSKEGGEGYGSLPPPILFHPPPPFSSDGQLPLGSMTATVRIGWNSLAQWAPFAPLPPLPWHRRRDVNRMTQTRTRWCFNETRDSTAVTFEERKRNNGNVFGDVAKSLDYYSRQTKSLTLPAGVSTSEFTINSSCCCRSH